MTLTIRFREIKIREQGFEDRRVEKVNVFFSNFGRKVSFISFIEIYLFFI